MNNCEKENQFGDFEDYLAEIYTPLKSIDVIVETIERKVNEDWNFLETNRKSAEELLSFIYPLKLVTKELLINRKEQVNNLFYSKKKRPFWVI